jgi:protein-S-isoprenylcysteine O-methyltransferase Ste14
MFGAGPLGVLLTILSVGLALIARDSYPSGSLGLPAPFRYLVLVCAGLATVAGVVWSFRSLPVAQRGHALCVQGAYHWVRHPLYASFITVLAPGFAIFLDHWVFLLWLAVLHLLWHLVIVLEERLMAARFGEEYRLHAQRTGRFVPRFVKPSPA